jgi:hypothetical protein
MELLTEIERIKSVMGLVTEIKKKLTRNEKFFWVSKNIGEWLYDEVFYSDYDLNRLPFFEMYKIYLTRKTRVNKNNREAVGQSLKDHYEDFLNIMEPQKSEDVIDEIKRVFPSIKDKIDSYGKKEKNPNERRGRKKLEKKPVVTSAIRRGRTDIDMSRLRPLSAVQQTPEPVIEPVNVPEPVTGEPDTENIEGRDSPTDVTVPLPPADAQDKTPAPSVAAPRAAWPPPPLACATLRWFATATRPAGWPAAARAAR